jgi:hypothetical protein
VDVIISEWMGYMLLYEVHIRILLIFWVNMYFEKLKQVIMKSVEETIN